MTNEPPNDQLAERATLGGMMLSKKAVNEVTAVLTASDFYRPVHGEIFAAIVDLTAAGEPVDAITVAAELEKRGSLNKVGGAPYLLDLLQSPPSPAHTAQYARMVAGKSRLRKLGELGVRLQQLAYSGVDDSDVEKVVGDGEKFFREIHQPSNVALGFDDLVDVWRKDQDSPQGAIRTPWEHLNRWLNGGLWRGKLHVIGGRPGDGKSNAGLNIASFVAQWGFSAAVFSMEMRAAEVASRIFAAGGEADFGQLIRREMDLETAQQVEAFIAANKGMDLEIIDQERITVEQIISHCRARPKLDVVFIDYLQLISPSDSRVSRQEQIAHISRSLKIAAAELNVAMVVAAQLNRDLVKGGKPRAPMISDLRESGAVEQDSDVVILLHRESGDDLVVKFIVGKNRNGRKGTLELPFRGSQARIG